MECARTRNPELRLRGSPGQKAANDCDSARAPTAGIDTFSQQPQRRPPYRIPPPTSFAGPTRRGSLMTCAGAAGDGYDSAPPGPGGVVHWRGCNMAPTIDVAGHPDRRRDDRAAISELRVSSERATRLPSNSGVGPRPASSKQWLPTTAPRTLPTDRYTPRRPGKDQKTPSHLCVEHLDHIQDGDAALRPGVDRSRRRECWLSSMERTDLLPVIHV